MSRHRNVDGIASASVNRTSILRVSAYYAAFSSLWIITSDLLVFRQGGDTVEGFLISMGKGLIFVVLTAVLIHFFILRALRNTESERDVLKKRLQEWSAHASDIIFLFDEQGRVLDANDRALQSYQYSQEDLRRLTVFDLIADATDGEAWWKGVVECSESRARIQARRCEGSTFPVEYSSRRIETNDGVLIQAIVRDMSEADAAQQQIVRLKDLYAALSQTNHCITQTNQREDLFKTTCEIAVRYGHFKLAWIAMANLEHKTLEAAAYAGEAVGYLEGINLSIDPASPLSQGASGQAFLTGKPVVLNEFTSRNMAPWRDRLSAFGIGSSAAFPLFLDDKPVGTLNLYSGVANFFAPDLTSLLVEMAQDISAALERMEMERQRGELAWELGRSHALISAILNGTDDIVLAINSEKNLTLRNTGFSRLAAEFGFADIIGKPIVPSQPVIADAWEKALQGNPVRCEWSARNANRVIHFESLFAPLYDQDLHVIGAFHVGKDITRHKQMELELRKLMTAIEQSPATVVVTDIHGTIEYVNPAFTATTGYKAEEVIGGNPRILKSGDLQPADYAAMWNRLLRGDPWEGSFHNKRKDGTLYWEEAVIAPVRDPAGHITQFIAIKQDVTQRREAEEHVRFLASYDSLTGLPNQLQGKDAFDKAMAEAEATHRKVALLFLDVDNFKRVNDSLGHLIGDHLLLALVERLKGCIRTVDTLSRHGGDEFLIVLANVEEDATIHHVAQRICDQVTMPFYVDGFELSTSVSIGIAIYPESGASFEELHRRADLAMYRAKKTGRNTHQVFTPTMETDAHEYLLILNGLRRAMEKQEFVLHYQPQIDLKTGRIVSAEGLIRWQHPELGLVQPGRFICIAEESGLIVEIGKWVIRECCRQVRQWHDAGHVGMIAAANVSSLQFRRGQLDEVVKDALQSAGISADSLELELTESVLAEDQNIVANMLKQLHEIGVRLALDDFGTGYSSFTYLTSFPIDKLKIDQSFVRNVSMNPKDEAVVSSVVRLAEDFGLRTVAEGVETRQALDAVRRAGCDMAQGFLFAKPMPAAELTALLEEEKQFLQLDSESRK